MAWWLIRKRGLTKEQRQMVLTSTGAGRMTLAGSGGEVFHRGPEANRWTRPVKDTCYLEDIGELDEEDMARTTMTSLMTKPKNLLMCLMWRSMMMYTQPTSMRRTRSWR